MKIGITKHFFHISYLCKKVCLCVCRFESVHDACISLNTCKSSLYFILVLVFVGSL